MLMHKGKTSLTDHKALQRIPSCLMLCAVHDALPPVSSSLLLTHTPPPPLDFQL